MTSVNLIPKARRQKSERRRRTRAWLGFLRAYSIALAIFACLAMLPAHAQAPSLDAALARIDRRLDSAAAYTAELRTRQAGLERALAISRAVADHPDWSLLLAAIARVRGADATLDTFDLTTTRSEEKPPASDKAAKPTVRDIHTIRLSGFAPSPTEVFQFARRLTDLNVADAVNVKDTHPQTFGPGGAAATHFEIEMTINGAPTAVAAKEGAAR